MIGSKDTGGLCSSMQINTNGMLGRRYFSYDLLDLTQGQEKFGIVPFILKSVTLSFKKLISHLSQWTSKDKLLVLDCCV